MDAIRKNKKIIIIGLLPALVIYILFAILPIFKSFQYGLTDWNGLGKMTYVGFDNFKEILTDKWFWLAFKNNIYVLIASVFGQIPIGLVLAVILNGKIKGAKVFRTLFFIPTILSTVVVALVWSNIYNYNIGILNNFLRILGLDSFVQNWLGDPKIAMLSICIVIIWQFIGLYMIIFLSALQNIPNSLNEAAFIDGASRVQQFFHITLPLIFDTVKVAVALCIAGSMKAFDLVFVMTEGGPSHATELMAIHMYNKTFSVYKYGYGSAVSLIIFIVSFLIILGSQRILKTSEQ
jgi:raffinose/stachyose/melibiose transport system permease protein